MEGGALASKLKGPGPSQSAVGSRWVFMTHCFFSPPPGGEGPGVGGLQRMKTPHPASLRSATLPTRGRGSMAPHPPLRGTFLPASGEKGK